MGGHLAGLPQPTHHSDPMSQSRADFIIKDILDNHLPRVIEGLRLGYVDENQILVIYDHAVRARIIREEEARSTVEPAIWKCRRCQQLVDVAARRCGCEEGPSPWEHINAPKS